MKLAEYKAKMIGVINDNGIKKIVAHTVDGTKVVITLGEQQAEVAEREFVQTPCA